MKKNIRWILLIMSVIMISLGVFRGEMHIVLEKAIMICFECIGLG